MTFVIALSGKIGSGKTTVTRLLCQNFDFQSVSFGAFVRKKALENGTSLNRESLQDLGQNLVEQDVITFCKNVLENSNWDKKSNLVIDGVRHISVYNILSELVSPLPMYLIYISTSDDMRRDRNKDVNLAKADLHQSENDVRSRLLEKADLIIDGDVAIEDIHKLLSNWILR